MINTDSLEKIAARLLAPGKGILAADESTGTADKRLAARGIPQNEEMRRKWRELLFTAPGIETGISGVILYDETMRQNGSDGVPLRDILAKRGIIPGIKVDKGTVELQNFPEEKVTEGLDGLSNRFAEYAAMGAQFAKWRAIIKIGDGSTGSPRDGSTGSPRDGSTGSPQGGIPTAECIEANAYLLARYAAISQEKGLVPIAEPEVLIDGDHTLAQSEDAIKKTLAAVFAMFKKYRIHLPGMILKSSMALPGKESGVKAEPREIAEATIRALKKSAPQELPGIVFLSGGQSSREAVENLNEIVKMGGYPWRITFSYSRALQESAMDAWAGQDANKTKAQGIFTALVRETALASEGKYIPPPTNQ